MIKSGMKNALNNRPWDIAEAGFGLHKTRAVRWARVGWHSLGVLVEGVGMVHVQGIELHMCAGWNGVVLWVGGWVGERVRRWGGGGGTDAPTTM